MYNVRNIDMLRTLYIFSLVLVYKPIPRSSDLGIGLYTNTLYISK